MKEFENSLVKGIHKSRYVASWVNVGGYFKYSDRYRFKEWLGTLVIDDEKLTPEEIQDIYNYATNGKFELEQSAKRYLTQ